MIAGTSSQNLMKMEAKEIDMIPTKRTKAVLIIVVSFFGLDPPQTFSDVIAKRQCPLEVI